MSDIRLWAFDPQIIRAALEQGIELRVWAFNPQIIHAVFEQGIEVQLAEDRWTISSAPPVSEAAFRSLAHAVIALSPVRVLLISEKRDYGGDLTYLLRCNGEYFGGYRMLMNRPLSTVLFYPVYSLAYLLGAIGYHCQKLAELYARITVEFFRFTQIPGYPDKEEVAGFDHQGAYYEFDALIGAVRRLYDSYLPSALHTFLPISQWCSLPTKKTPGERR
ncbi:hypothetical protein ES708_24810 [subsurface metagenome]